MKSIKTLSKLSIEQILKSYTFPHRFYVKYACICARKAMALTKDQDPISLAAIVLAERFSQGEDIPQKDLDAAAYSAAAYSASAAYFAASAAATAAYSSVYSAAATTAISCRATTAAASYAIDAGVKEEELRSLLLDMINELTPFEFIMMRKKV